MKEKTLSIVDYGIGNLRSVQKAFESFGGKCNITSSVDEILNSDGIILPGVGAFPDAMENIKKLNMDKALKNAAEAGVPILGICLGMQLLFDESDEIRPTEGLGLIKGRIKKFEVNLKIPHMGWNSLNILKKSPLLEGVKDGSYAYFVHSYYAELEEDNLDADSFYGINVPAAVSKNNVFGFQFHPEKSGDPGIKMLKNFWGLL
ncbi:imidazole glycerol phosphate synthase subunit HisH [Clostridium pasteurianum DSM 525 = ATCC 6013]|uniref:Imidazole glycerol phosphate synthase subunit HisH n=1 Tax=Clostridium pasteurianum DSM 525 = ATCC 6013 TaxID=1262449 RepID=A0A0H3J7Z2_CLOPA|nr:imidazole glycerol phosphate synthase subunit HisH [Clostridium pasteurianum]AJA49332.1 imidazole glycerol phosphate synthase subunit HisH [Clostridium pasteurianum DSM 525 = ATCC 6013]AJA53320.1 imidazole glycerol phosphate synthase subunit HisH [Clostridium pasteurianum DSM 525 = ATCC 6013]AOZ76507.1 imidazole glycerol phosphate synthase subunit HisH [Clostridium pasteurianum DSM 525 = ATCC 6013]AOZ80304.1 imidazole glycerol phosphate synthase subunit HisH [Clostridium pasteurianum]ELP583